MEEQMTDTTTIHDPFLNKDVQVSSRLTDRLRGKYAVGPIMENGEPEFGWRQHEVPPIQIEAADRIEALEKHKRLQMEDIMNLGAQLGQARLRIKQLEAEVEKWHRVAMDAGAVTCVGGGHIYPLRDRVKQSEAALRAIVIRCEEGDKKFDWLPTISNIARAALAPKQDK